MVDSADEPPLANHLHSWARKTRTLFNLSLFSKEKDTAASTLPQYAGQATPSDDRTGDPTASETKDHGLNTRSQGTSTLGTQGDGEKSPAVSGSTDESKPSLTKRFVRDVHRILGASWINWLLLFVPVAITLGALQDWGHKQIVNPSVIFALNAVAIVPLASLLAFATESVASRLGDTVGALLNVTFGNAVELIIFILALVAGEIRIVQAAALGSILSNLLLILGMCFVLGGLRYREQLYNPSVSQMSACLLSLSVISLVLPTAFHAAFTDTVVADRVVVKVSRGTSVILLVVYVLYLLFQLKSHAFMYESTPQEKIDEESHPGVLADVFHSSSSSDDDSSSSSSDSDGSHSTARRRLKLALRRKRRKSSSSTNKEVPSPPSFSRSNTLMTDRDSSRVVALDGDGSADEADTEAKPRQPAAAGSILTRDFETTTPASKKRSKRFKRHQKSRQAEQQTTFDSMNRTNHLNEQTSNLGAKDETSNSRLLVPSVEVPSAATDMQHVPPGAALRRPMNLHRLSSAIRPAFNSTVFPHHQASGKSLALPAIRLLPPPPQDSQRGLPSSELRRTTSMPDIRRQISPMPPRMSHHPYIDPQDLVPEVQIQDGFDPHTHLSKTSSVILLLCTTGLVALCAEFLVGSIDYMVTSSGVSQVFIGLIILPIVGNAAEHVTAVTVAYKNKMDLAINIALGSSIQIALFVTPLMVLLGWAIGPGTGSSSTPMSLYFSLFETVSLFASAFIVNYLMIDGRSNYLEGTLLIAVYIIIGIAAFFYPDSAAAAN